MKNKLNSGWVIDLLLIIGVALGLWLKIIYSQFSTKISIGPFSSHENRLMVILSFLLIVMIIALLYGLTHQWGLKVVFGISFILCFMLFGDTIYGRYFSSLASITIFYQSKDVGDAWEAVVELTKMLDIVFLLDYVVMALVYLVARKLQWHRKHHTFKWQVLLLSGLVFVLAFAGFKVQFQQVDTVKFVYERKYIAKNVGLLYYHGYDFVDYYHDKLVKRKLTEEEVALVEGLNGSKHLKTNAMTGIAKDRNLIVIQVEAMMSYLIDYEVEGIPVTPFLNELKKESIFLAENYVQTANGNTADAEVLMNMSLFPTQRGSIYYEHANNTFYTLPDLLNDHGYTSHSYHGYERSFWNRSFMHPHMGFEQFYSLEDFDLKDKIGWAISDESFFEQSLAYSMSNDHEPFYDFMITLSSHYPYDGFYSGPFNDLGIEPVVLKNYYNAIHYVDSALERYINDLKEAGLYERSLIVIYGDHSGLFGDEAIAQVVRDGKTYNDYEWMKYLTTPVFIHIPGETNDGQVVDDVTGQIDILPTVLNLMDLSMPYTLGHDLLDDGYESFVVKRFGDIITNDYIYINNTRIFYDRITGEILDDEGFAQDLKRSSDFLRGSDMILQSDYFRSFKE